MSASQSQINSAPYVKAINGDGTDGGLGGLLLSGERQEANLLAVEQQYSYFRKTADGQVKAGAGFLHSFTVGATGTVTAGVITIYDSLTESGTIIDSFIVNVGTPIIPVIKNVSFATGLFIWFDGTVANVAVSGSYR